MFLGSVAERGAALSTVRARACCEHYTTPACLPCCCRGTPIHSEPRTWPTSLLLQLLPLGMSGQDRT